MLSIAILLGIGMILNIQSTNGDYNVLIAAPLVVSLFALNAIALAIITMVILVFIAIQSIQNQDKY